MDKYVLGPTASDVYEVPGLDRRPAKTQPQIIAPTHDVFPPPPEQGPVFLGEALPETLADGHRSLVASPACSQKHDPEASPRLDDQELVTIRLDGDEPLFKMPVAIGAPPRKRARPFAKEAPSDYPKDLHRSSPRVRAVEKQSDGFRSVNTVVVPSISGPIDPHASALVVALRKLSIGKGQTTKNALAKCNYFVEMIKVVKGLTNDQCLSLLKLSVGWKEDNLEASQLMAILLLFSPFSPKDPHLKIFLGLLPAAWPPALEYLRQPCYQWRFEESIRTKAFPWRTEMFNALKAAYWRI